MIEWSSHWKSSKAPKKQRKYRHTAPLHIRHRMLAAHLNEELASKYKKRSFALRKGDKVKVMRGEFKGTIGEIERVDIKKLKVYVKGVEFKRREGQASRPYPVDPSKVQILELKLDDKFRKEAIGRK